MIKRLAERLDMSSWRLALLGISMPAIAASAAFGVAPSVAAFLAPLGLLAVLMPVLIPVSVLFISPLLGGTGDSTLFGLGGMEILGLWLIATGGIVVGANMKVAFRNKTVLIASAVVALNFFSVLVSDSRFVSIAESVRALSAFMMLPLAYVLAGNAGGKRILIGSVVASSFVPLAAGLYQKISGNIGFGVNVTEFELRTGLVRIYSTFWDVHSYAKYLLVLLPLFLVFFLSEKKRLHLKAFWFVIFSLAFVSLVFTYARSELIGFMLSAFLVLLRLKKVKAGTVLLYALPVLAVFYASGMLERFSDVMKPISYDAPGRESSLESRLIIWMTGFPLALKRPILGHGADTFEAAVGIIAHNDYLGLFYDLGLAGPVLYLLFLLFATRASARCAAEPGTGSLERVVSLAVYSAAPAIMIVSVAENLFKATLMWWFFFSLLAIALRCGDDLRAAEGKKAEG